MVDVEGELVCIAEEVSESFEITLGFDRAVNTLAIFGELRKNGSHDDVENG